MRALIYTIDAGYGGMKHLHPTISNAPVKKSVIHDDVLISIFVDLILNVFCSYFRCIAQQHSYQ